MNTRCNGLAGFGCNCPGYAGVWKDGASIHRMGSTYCWRRRDGSDRLPGDPDFRSPYHDNTQASSHGS